MVQRIFIKGAVPSFYRPPPFPQPDISKCLMSLLDFFSSPLFLFTVRVLMRHKQMREQERMWMMLKEYKKYFFFDIRMISLGIFSVGVEIFRFLYFIRKIKCFTFTIPLRFVIFRALLPYMLHRQSTALLGSGVEIRSNQLGANGT